MRGCQEEKYGREANNFVYCLGLKFMSLGIEKVWSYPLSIFYKTVESFFDSFSPLISATYPLEQLIPIEQIFFTPIFQKYLNVFIALLCTFLKPFEIPIAPYLLFVAVVSKNLKASGFKDSLIKGYLARV